MSDNRRFAANAAATVMAGILALATPALAAGASPNMAADKTGSDRVVASTTTAARQEAPGTPLRSYLAEGEPRRLSDLAGNDERAWTSARSVRVRLSQRKAPR